MTKKATVAASDVHVSKENSNDTAEKKPSPSSKKKKAKSAAVNPAADGAAAAKTAINDSGDNINAADGKEKKAGAKKKGDGKAGAKAAGARGKKVVAKAATATATAKKTGTKDIDATTASDSNKDDNGEEKSPIKEKSGATSKPVAHGVAVNGNGAADNDHNNGDMATNQSADGEEQKKDDGADVPFVAIIQQKVGVLSSREANLMGDIAKGGGVLQAGVLNEWTTDTRTLRREIHSLDSDWIRRAINALLYWSKAPPSEWRPFIDEARIPSQWTEGQYLMLGYYLLSYPEMASRMTTWSCHMNAFLPAAYYPSGQSYPPGTEPLMIPLTSIHHIVNGYEWMKRCLEGKVVDAKDLREWYSKKDDPTKFNIERLIATHHNELPKIPHQGIPLRQSYYYSYLPLSTTIEKCLCATKLPEVSVTKLVKHQFISDLQILKSINDSGYDDTIDITVVGATRFATMFDAVLLMQSTTRGKQRFVSYKDVQAEIRTQTEYLIPEHHRHLVPGPLEGEAFEADAHDIIIILNFMAIVSRITCGRHKPDVTQARQLYHLVTSLGWSADTANKDRLKKVAVAAYPTGVILWQLLAVLLDQRIVLWRHLADKPNDDTIVAEVFQSEQSAGETDAHCSSHQLTWMQAKKWLITDAKHDDHIVMIEGSSVAVVNWPVPDRDHTPSLVRHERKSVRTAAAAHERTREVVGERKQSRRLKQHHSTDKDENKQSGIGGNDEQPDLDGTVVGDGINRTHQVQSETKKTTATTPKKKTPIKQSAGVTHDDMLIITGESQQRDFCLLVTNDIDFAEDQKVSRCLNYVVGVYDIATLNHHIANIRAGDETPRMVPMRGMLLPKVCSEHRATVNNEIGKLNRSIITKALSKGRHEQCLTNNNEPVKQSPLCYVNQNIKCGNTILSDAATGYAERLTLQPATFLDEKAALTALIPPRFAITPPPPPATFRIKRDAVALVVIIDGDADNMRALYVAYRAIQGGRFDGTVTAVENVRNRLCEYIAHRVRFSWTTQSAGDGIDFVHSPYHWLIKPFGSVAVATNYGDDVDLVRQTRTCEELRDQYDQAKQLSTKQQLRIIDDTNTTIIAPPESGFIIKPTSTGFTAQRLRDGWSPIHEIHLEHPNSIHFVIYVLTVMTRAVHGGVVQLSYKLRELVYQRLRYLEEADNNDVPEYKGTNRYMSAVEAVCGCSIRTRALPQQYKSHLPVWPPQSHPALLVPWWHRFTKLEADGTRHRNERTRLDQVWASDHSFVAYWDFERFPVLYFDRTDAVEASRANMVDMIQSKVSDQYYHHGLPTADYAVTSDDTIRFRVLGGFFRFFRSSSNEPRVFGATSSKAMICSIEAFIRALKKHGNLMQLFYLLFGHRETNESGSFNMLLGICDDEADRVEQIIADEIKTVGMDDRTDAHAEDIDNDSTDGKYGEEHKESDPVPGAETYLNKHGTMTSSEAVGNGNDSSSSSDDDDPSGSDRMADDVPPEAKARGVWWDQHGRLDNSNFDHRKLRLASTLCTYGGLCCRRDKGGRPHTGTHRCSTDGCNLRLHADCALFVMALTSKKMAKEALKEAKNASKAAGCYRVKLPCSLHMREDIIRTAREAFNISYDKVESLLNPHTNFVWPKPTDAMPRPVQWTEWAAGWRHDIRPQDESGYEHTEGTDHHCSYGRFCQVPITRGDNSGGWTNKTCTVGSCTKYYHWRCWIAMQTVRGFDTTQSYCMALSELGTCMDHVSAEVINTAMIALDDKLVVEQHDYAGDIANWVNEYRWPPNHQSTPILLSTVVSILQQQKPRWTSFGGPNGIVETVSILISLKIAMNGRQLTWRDDMTTKIIDPPLDLEQHQTALGWLVNYIKEAKVARPPSPVPLSKMVSALKVARPDLTSAGMWQVFLMSMPAIMDSANMEYLYDIDRPNVVIKWWPKSINNVTDGEVRASLNKWLEHDYKEIDTTKRMHVEITNALCSRVAEMGGWVWPMPREDGLRLGKLLHAAFEARYKDLDLKVKIAIV